MVATVAKRLFTALPNLAGEKARNGSLEQTQNTMSYDLFGQTHQPTIGDIEAGKVRFREKSGRAVQDTQSVWVDGPRKGQTVQPGQLRAAVDKANVAANRAAGAVYVAQGTGIGAAVGGVLRAFGII